MKPEQKENVTALSSLCEAVHVVPTVVGGRNYLKRILSLLRGSSFGMERFRCAQFRDKIAEILAQRHFDLIIADSLYVLPNLPKTSVPLALNTHNVEWIILHRYAEIERNLIKRSYARVEARRIREAESRALAQSVVAFACSQQDASLLRQLHDVRVEIVPNAMDTEFYAPCRTWAKAHPAQILFLGSLDWFPNVDAVHFFLDQIFPIIRNEYPDALFRAVGRNPSSELLARSDPSAGIEILGPVPDVRPYLGPAAVIVVPLRIGGGTRLKIIEAAASRKAIVSTSLGAEGLDFVDRKDLLLADTPDLFAQKVLDILRDPSLASSLADNALRRAADYGTAALEAHLARALRSPEVAK
jgi:glycosyltransferase involved in cell wall biosynthesis